MPLSGTAQLSASLRTCTLTSTSSQVGTTPVTFAGSYPVRPCLPSPVLSSTSPLLPGPGNPLVSETTDTLTAAAPCAHRHPQGLPSRAAHPTHHPAPVSGGPGGHGPRAPKQNSPKSRGHPRAPQLPAGCGKGELALVGVAGDGASRTRRALQPCLSL